MLLWTSLCGVCRQSKSTPNKKTNQATTTLIPSSQGTRHPLDLGNLLHAPMFNSHLRTYPFSAAAAQRRCIFSSWVSFFFAIIFFMGRVAIATMFNEQAATRALQAVKYLSSYVLRPYNRDTFHQAM